VNTYMHAGYCVLVYLRCGGTLQRPGQWPLCELDCVLESAVPRDSPCQKHKVCYTQIHTHCLHVFTLTIRYTVN